MVSNGLPLRHHQRPPLPSGSYTDGLSAGTVPPHCASPRQQMQREPWESPFTQGSSLGAAPRTASGTLPRGRSRDTRGFIHLLKDSLRGGSHTTPQGPQRVVRDPQTRPLGCLPGPRRPRPRLPGPSGCGTRVRDWRTLHREPRAAHGRSGAGVLGPSAGSRRRGRSSRLRRQPRRRARPKHTHPPRAAAARAPARDDLRGPVGARPAPPSCASRRGPVGSAGDLAWD